LTELRLRQRVRRAGRVTVGHENASLSPIATLPAVPIGGQDQGEEVRMNESSSPPPGSRLVRRTVEEYEPEAPDLDLDGDEDRDVDDEEPANPRGRR
jgi:hypothetical protein